MADDMVVMKNDYENQQEYLKRELEKVVRQCEEKMRVFEE